MEGTMRSSNLTLDNLRSNADSSLESGVDQGGRALVAPGVPGREDVFGVWLELERVAGMVDRMVGP